MKTICFYFQIHLPFRLKRYRFFDIGNDHYYYDDFQNKVIIHRIAEQCYLPANRTILEMIKTSGGKFKGSVLYFRRSVGADGDLYSGSDR